MKFALTKKCCLNIHIYIYIYIYIYMIFIECDQKGIFYKPFHFSFFLLPKNVNANYSYFFFGQIDMFNFIWNYSSNSIVFGTILLILMDLVPFSYFGTICCMLTFDPAKHAIPKWCTGRKWHIPMTVMRRNRVGGLGWKNGTW